MWFFYLAGGLIVIAFIGIGVEGRQMRARARLIQPPQRFTADCRRDCRRQA
jgi:hypothetical protein